LKNGLKLITDKLFHIYDDDDDDDDTVTVIIGDDDDDDDDDDDYTVYLQLSNIIGQDWVSSGYL